ARIYREEWVNHEASKQRSRRESNRGSRIEDGARNRRDRVTSITYKKKGARETVPAVPVLRDVAMTAGRANGQLLECDRRQEAILRSIQRGAVGGERSGRRITNHPERA